MGLVVQKYGGSSLGSVEAVKSVAERIKVTCQGGDSVVVVVSARGGVTDALIQRAKAISENPDPERMDALLALGEQEMVGLMCMALEAIGVPSLGRTGGEAGVITDSNHLSANILSVNGGDIIQRLAEGNVVVVAGFQGVTREGKVTTLGRGGSDLTAVALAVALGADICQIYTDVDGVYNADPRQVSGAQKIQSMGYDGMFEFACSGAKVMQSRAVALAKKYDMPFEIRLNSGEVDGTLIHGGIECYEGAEVTGVFVDPGKTLLRISGLPRENGVELAILGSLLNANVLTSLVSFVSGIHLSFALEDAQLSDGIASLQVLFKEQSWVCPEIFKEKVGVLAVVGTSICYNSEVMESLFQILREFEIDPVAMVISEGKLCCAIRDGIPEDLLAAMHSHFRLNEAVLL